MTSMVWWQDGTGFRQHVIPFEKGLLGHSDADVLVHAVCDALLGAADWRISVYIFRIPIQNTKISPV